MATATETVAVVVAAAATRVEVAAYARDSSIIILNKLITYY